MCVCVCVCVLGTHDVMVCVCLQNAEVKLHNLLEGGWMVDIQRTEVRHTMYMYLPGHAPHM